MDAEATARHRERLRAERVARFGRAAAVRTGQLLLEVTPYLHARRDERGAFWACPKCSAELGAIEDNYKLGCNREDRHISTFQPAHAASPATSSTTTSSFVSSRAPGCGTLIENEVAVANDPVLRDIELRVGADGGES